MSSHPSSTLSETFARRSSARLRGDELILLMECERPLGGSSRHALEEIDEVVVSRGPQRAARRVAHAHSRRNSDGGRTVQACTVASTKVRRGSEGRVIKA